MTDFDIMRSAAAGMAAERAALDLAARNVAAAQAAEGPGGFARLVPRFAVEPAGGTDTGDFEPPDPNGAAARDEPVRYVGAGVERGRDADAVTEMVAVLDAQRAFEANASVFDIGKRLAERTIDAGRLQ